MIKLFLIFFIVIVAYYARQKKALSISGTYGLLLIGVVTIVAFSYKGLTLLGLFFVTSSLAGRWPNNNNDTNYNRRKTPERVLSQVMANGYMALIASIGQLLWPSPVWIGVLAGSMAEANADTWASEIGVTSLAMPRSVVSFRKLPPGVSGGVSLKGFVASFIGAVVISVVAYYLCVPKYFVLSNFVLIFSLMGFIGSYIDSLLGALCQGTYQCQICQTLTDDRDHCQEKTVKVSGVSWISNSVVNGISTGICGLLGGVIFLWY